MEGSKEQPRDLNKQGCALLLRTGSSQDHLYKQACKCDFSENRNAGLTRSLPLISPLRVPLSRIYSKRSRAYVFRSASMLVLLTFLAAVFSCELLLGILPLSLPRVSPFRLHCV